MVYVYGDNSNFCLYTWGGFSRTCVPQHRGIMNNTLRGFLRTCVPHYSRTMLHTFISGGTDLHYNQKSKSYKEAQLWACWHKLGRHTTSQNNYIHTSWKGTGYGVFGFDIFVLFEKQRKDVKFHRTIISIHLEKLLDMVCLVLTLLFFQKSKGNMSNFDQILTLSLYPMVDQEILSYFFICWNSKNNRKTLRLSSIFCVTLLRTHLWHRNQLLSEYIKTAAAAA